MRSPFSPNIISDVTANNHRERNRVDAWIEDFKLLLWSSMRVWVCIDFRTPKIKIALTRILYDSTSEQKLLSKATNFLCDVWARNGKNKGLTSQNIAKGQHGYGGDWILKSTAVCRLDFYCRSCKTTLHSAQRCSKHICEVSSPLPKL